MLLTNKRNGDIKDWDWADRRKKQEVPTYKKED